MLLIIVFFSLIALIDLIPIVKKKLWHDFAAWMILFLPAVAISVLIALHIKIPSAMILIGDALKAIGLSY